MTRKDKMISTKGTLSMLSMLNSFFESLSVRKFVYFWLFVIFVLIVVIAIVMFSEQKTINCPLPCTNRQNNAKDAVALLKDTTTWLASIQTATIAALGFIAKDGIPTIKASENQMKWSIAVVILNSIALFFSAWVLTALPSVQMRVYSDPVKYFDFFTLPLYKIMGDGLIGKILNVNFFVTCNHVLWCLGVFVFGWLCSSVAVSRSKPNQ